MIYADPQDWLILLLRQTLVLSAATLVLLLMRRPLQRTFGAGAAYASWALVPLLLLVSTLPAHPVGAAVRADLSARLEPWLGPPLPPMALEPSDAWAWVLLTLWGAGAVLTLVRLVRLQRCYQRELRPENSGWRGPAGSSPALVGLLSPRLVLPADFETRYSPAQRQLVLAHEAVHRRRGDNFWNALAALLSALHWFNPLAGLARRALRAAQELAVDAAVMAQHPGRSADYAQALLHAQSPFPSPAQALPWAQWQSTHPLIERIAMLQRPPTSRTRRNLGLSLIAGLAAGGSGLVQAIVAETPTPTIALELSVEVMLREGDNKQTMRGELTLALAPGKTGQLILNHPNRPENEQVVVTFSAEERPEDFVMILADVQRGDPPASVAKPRVMTKFGVQARIERGVDNPDRSELLSIKVKPRRLGQPT